MRQIYTIPNGFTHKNNKRQPRFAFQNRWNIITGSGVILYKWIGTELFVLLQKNLDIKHHNYGKYEDLGGKVDKYDVNFFETAAREAQEESNDVFKKKDLYTRMMCGRRKVMSVGSYNVIIMEAIDNEKYLNSRMFGNTEFHTGCLREIQWTPCSQIENNDIVHRIKPLKSFLRSHLGANVLVY
jgi:hypothetical protein